MDNGFQKYLIDKGFKRYYYDWDKKEYIESYSLFISTYSVIDYVFKSDEYPFELKWGLDMKGLPPGMSFYPAEIKTTNNKEDMIVTDWNEFFASRRIEKEIDYDDIFDVIVNHKTKYFHVVRDGEISIRNYD